MVWQHRLLIAWQTVLSLRWMARLVSGLRDQFQNQKRMAPQRAMMLDPDPPREAWSHCAMLKPGSSHLGYVVVYLENGASGGYREHSS